MSGRGESSIGYRRSSKDLWRCPSSGVHGSSWVDPTKVNLNVSIKMCASFYLTEMQEIAVTCDLSDTYIPSTDHAKLIMIRGNMGRVAKYGLA